MLEVAHHPLRRFLQAAQMADGGLLEVVFSSGQSAHNGLGLNVEHLIEGQLQAIGRQVKHLDLLAMFGQPDFDWLGRVDLQVAQNQEQLLASAILDQALHEIDQKVCLHGACKHPPAYLATVGHRRHH